MADLIYLLDRPIAFHRSFVHLTKNIKAALFLSQCVYWSNRTNDPAGWFYKAHSEWTEETGLSRKEQATAREVLKSLNILEEKLLGVPATLHYRINSELLESLLKSLEFSCPRTSQLDVPNGTNKMSPNGTTISEITTITAKRGKLKKTQLNEDFSVSDSMMKWAQEKFQNIDPKWIIEETENFKDYYIAKGSEWVDWIRVWQKWIRTSDKKRFIDQKKEPPSNGAPLPPDVSKDDYVLDNSTMQLAKNQDGSFIEKYARNEDGSFNRKKFSKECLRYIRKYKPLIIEQAEARRNRLKEKLSEKDCMLLEMDYEAYNIYWEELEKERAKRNN